MWEVRYGKQALKALSCMPVNTARQIREKLLHLALNPYARNNNVKRLSDGESFRLRVGDWRVVYQLEDGILVISVVRIATRGGVYQ